MEESKKIIYESLYDWNSRVKFSEEFEYVEHKNKHVQILINNDSTSVFFFYKSLELMAFNGDLSMGVELIKKLVFCSLGS